MIIKKEKWVLASPIKAPVEGVVKSASAGHPVYDSFYNASGHIYDAVDRGSVARLSCSSRLFKKVLRTRLSSWSLQCD